MPHPTLLITHEAMLNHSNGPGHPEQPERLRATRARLERGAPDAVTWQLAKPARREELERIHTAAYIDELEALRGLSARLDEDTALSPGSVDAAWLAAGAAVEATRSVMTGETTRAWALVRPPGHHAEADRAMGFCLFNNVAVAAAAARHELGARRVLIIDWDVHHGNGTQNTFYSDPSVLFVSSHQAPFYPGTGGVREQGEGAGAGYTVNMPLPAGVRDDDLVALYRELLPPLARAFGPDLILVSAGFDAHEHDPLADFHLSSDGFAALTQLVCDLADELCDGRLVFTLEGGYDVDALTGSCLACLRVLTGATRVEVPSRTGEMARVVLPHLRRHHGAHWPCLAAPAVEP